jgi:hypothetical protein
MMAEANSTTGLANAIWRFSLSRQGGGRIFSVVAKWQARWKWESD